MPIYEYICSQCHRISSFLLLRASERLEPYCTSCGSKKVTRVLSHVSVIKSEERRIEGLLDPHNLSGLDENDPRSIEKFMKKMDGPLKDEIGEGFDEAMEEAMNVSTPNAEETL
ncbi:MAG TPA: FmdB family transcriptional regulator [Deltaproteobacteria bacterium]|nr:FmdB family transcriptional regulator [Deltaproteobacteria bacterium]